MRRSFKLLVEWPLALALALAATPLMAAVALLILVADGPPVLYRAPRVGRGGRQFSLLKFRTLSSPGGASIAPAGDPRIFLPAGALRRWRLDELPQLLQVLWGDLALVGPRPLPPAHADALDREFRARLLAVRPGITGPSAIAFLADDEALRGVDDAEQRYLADVLPAKVALDSAYLQNWSLGADFRLLVQTLHGLVSRRARQESRDRVAGLLAEKQSGDGQ